MKKRSIWKSFDLYTIEEEEEVLKDLKQFNEEVGQEMDDDELRNFANDTINDYFNDDFSEKYGNVNYSPLKDTKCVILGSLGLWNGRHTIEPVYCDTIREAVCKCFGRDCDTGEVYEDRYGNLCVDAYHHDGTNHFIIKKNTPKGLRCVHFCKEVYGC